MNQMNKDARDGIKSVTLPLRTCEGVSVQSSEGRVNRQSAVVLSDGNFKEP
jgi:hypothetical protein